MSGFSSFILGILVGIGGLWFFMNLELFKQFVSDLNDGGNNNLADHDYISSTSQVRQSGATKVDNHPSSSPPKLLLISFDGFRWDYIHLTDTPNIDWMIQRGSHAPRGIKNTFITITAPNHYAMVTGLYEESSGIVSNKFFEPQLNETFDYWITLGKTDPRLFAHGTPIWSLNDEQSVDATEGQFGADRQRRTGCSQWIGCDVMIGGKPLPYYHESWNASQKFDEFFGRVDKMMELFLDEQKPVNLGVLYFPQPDEIGHQYGPHDYRSWEVVRQMDQLLGYTLWALERSGLLSDTNVILTADHGMADVPVANNIYLDDYVQRDWYSTDSAGPNWNIQPDPGFEDIMVSRLSGVEGLSVYRKSELPPEYHYRNTENVLALQLEADLHYNILLNRSYASGPISVRSKSIPISDQIYGAHGYNNSLSEMHPIFVGMGPAFKVGYKCDQFENVDIYPLMAQILEIPLSNLPANNGSFSRVKSLLTQQFYSDEKENVPSPAVEVDLIDDPTNDDPFGWEYVGEPNAAGDDAIFTGNVHSPRQGAAFYGAFTRAHVRQLLVHHCRNNIPLVLFAVLFLVLVLVSFFRRGGGSANPAAADPFSISKRLSPAGARRATKKLIRKEDISLIQPNGLHLKRDDDSMIIQLTWGIDAIDLGVRRNNPSFSMFLGDNQENSPTQAGPPPSYFPYVTLPSNSSPSRDNMSRLASKADSPMGYPSTRMPNKSWTPGKEE